MMKKKRVLLTLIIALLAVSAPMIGLRSVGAAKKANEYAGKAATTAGMSAGPVGREVTAEAGGQDKRMDDLGQSTVVISRVGFYRPVGFKDVWAFSQVVATCAA